jgi:hypothetical protein
MTPQEYFKANGRHAPAPLPPVTDLLSSIVEGYKKLGNKLTPTRQAVVQTQLSGVLSNINADLNDIIVDAKVKNNQEQQARIKTARAALDTPVTTGA